MCQKPDKRNKDKRRRTKRLELWREKQALLAKPTTEASAKAAAAR